jgi:hypothetical protein
MNRVPVRRLLAPVLVVAVGAACGDAGGPAEPSPTVAATVAVTPAQDTLAFGEQTTLQAVAYDESGAVVQGAQFSWQSSAPGVVFVDASGRVEARGVGTGRVTASVGQAEGSADLAVEPARMALAASALEAPAYRIVTLELPEAVPVPATATAKVDGEIGGETVAFTVAGRTLDFVAPALPAGTHEGSVPFSENVTGTFTFTALPAPSVTAPDAVASELVTKVEEQLATLTAGPAAAAAQQALEVFEARFAALSAAERMRAAGIIAANPDAFAVAAPPSAAFAVSGALAGRDGLATVQQLPETVGKVTSHVEDAMGIARTCTGTGRDEVCVVSAASAATTQTNLSLVDELINEAKAAVRSMIVSDPEKRQPKATKYTTFGVRGVRIDGLASLATSQDEGLLNAGTRYALELDVDFRTPTAEEAARAPLTPLGAALDELNDLWHAAGALFGDVSSTLSADVGLEGGPPALPSPPEVSAGTIPGEYLSLAAVSNPAVVCESAHEEGQFVLSCTTEATEPQQAVLQVSYASPLSSATYDLPVTVESGQGNVVGSYKMESFGGDALPVVVFSSAEAMIELLGGTMDLNHDGTYRMVFRIRDTYKETNEIREGNSFAEGVWSATGSTYQLTNLYTDGDPDEEPFTYSATLTSDRLTLLVTGDDGTQQVYAVYRRL